MATGLSDLLSGWQQTLNAGPVSMAVQATDADDNDASVSDTVALMGSHTNKAKADPKVLGALKAAGITASTSEDECINRVFRYIKSKVKFVEDPVQLARMFKVPDSKELLITPPVILSMKKPQGDCDDFSMLACSMLRACGIKCNFVTVAADERSPDTFTHVYCLVTKSNGEQVPFDASHGTRVGWETWKQWRREVWPFLDWNDLRGNGMFGLGTDSAAEDAWLNYGVIAKTGFDWTSVIPGIFSAGEKIGIQLTQPAGYQTMGPNGQYTSYVLPNGANASGVLNIPGTSVGSMSSSSMLLLGGLLIGGIVLFKAIAK